MRLSWTGSSGRLPSTPALRPAGDRAPGRRDRDRRAGRGRADLLAQGAGIAAGFHCGRADEARYLRAAQLCIEAGADTGQVHRWAEEGRRRAAITWQQASRPGPGH